MDKLKEMIIKMCEIRCKRCNHILTNKLSISRGMGDTCYRIIQLQKAKQPEQPEQFDMKEIKVFITSEIQKALKEFNFNRPVINNNTENNGIIPKTTNIPKFNPIEANKRLVVKELKEQIQKGINKILQEVGSFDEQINFIETVEILA